MTTAMGVYSLTSLIYVPRQQLKTYFRMGVYFLLPVCLSNRGNFTRLRILQICGSTTLDRKCIFCQQLEICSVDQNM